MKVTIEKVILFIGDVSDIVYFANIAKKLEEYKIPIEQYQLADVRDCMWNGTLYITDQASCARLLQAKNIPVLGWYHQGGDSLEGLPYLMEVVEEIDVQYLERVYRRFKGIPWDILETKRCYVRETMVEDVDHFLKIYANSEIVRYMEDLYPPEEERTYIQEYIEKVYRYFEFGVWTVICKETGEVIGRAGFSVRDGYDIPELGFVIAIPWQGKGIATEICRAILDYGEREFGFEKVQALVRMENVSSLSLCRKLGFVPVDTIYEDEGWYQRFIRQEIKT